MSTTNELTAKHDTAVEIDDTPTTEERVAELSAQLRDTRTELEQVRRDLDSLRAAVDQLAAKSVATCKKCGATYDIFSHHYSIGLFDNIVYVKCPDCQTPMPVDPRLGVRAE
jgi:predicted Zn-ribbon and HTH transcriptional regulator